MSRQYRKTFRAVHIQECCHCKSTNDLEVHHVDFNHENNKPQNLVGLCHSCHVAIHRKRTHPELKDSIQTSIDEYVYDFVATNQDVIFFNDRGVMEVTKSEVGYRIGARRSKNKITNYEDYLLMLHDPRIGVVLSRRRVDQQMMQMGN